jgi:hypothetical protein
MYGRGCSSAFVQAQALAQVLQASRDPGTRARDYYRRTRALLHPVFELSANTDRLYHVRAKLRRGHGVSLAERVLNFFYERAFLRANQESLHVAREFVKATQMRETSSLGARVLSGWHMLLALLRGVLRRDSARFLPDVPEHGELLRRLALPSTTAPASHAPPELEQARHES